MKHHSLLPGPWCYLLRGFWIHAECLFSDFSPAVCRLNRRRHLSPTTLSTPLVKYHRAAQHFQTLLKYCSRQPPSSDGQADCSDLTGAVITVFVVFYAKLTKMNWFQLLKCHCFLVFVVVHDNKLNILAVWTLSWTKQAVWTCEGHLNVFIFYYFLMFLETKWFIEKIISTLPRLQVALDKSAKWQNINVNVKSWHANILLTC